MVFAILTLRVGHAAPFKSRGAPPPVCTPDTPASTCWRTCTCTGCARTPGGSPGAGQQSQGAAGRRHDDNKAAHGVPNHVSSPCSGAHRLDQVSLEGRVVGRTEERRSRERVEAQIVPSN